MKIAVTLYLSDQFEPRDSEAANEHARAIEALIVNWVNAVPTLALDDYERQIEDAEWADLNADAARAADDQLDMIDYARRCAGM